MEKITPEEEVELLEQVISGLESKINLIRASLEIIDEEDGDSDLLENELSDFNDIIDEINDMIDSLNEYN